MSVEVRVKTHFLTFFGAVTVIKQINGCIPRRCVKSSIGISDPISKESLTIIIDAKTGITMFNIMSNMFIIKGIKGGL